MQSNDEAFYSTQYYPYSTWEQQHSTDHSKLLIIPNGFNIAGNSESCGFPAEFGMKFTEELGCYGVINNKYKKAIVDLADVEQAKSSKRTTDTFLLRIKRFKDEISGNGLLPLVLIVQTEPASFTDSNHILKNLYIPAS